MPSEANYFSFVQQTFHYFSRPHSNAPIGPVHSAAAWRAADMRADKDWREEADIADIEEIDRAMANAQATGKELGALTREDFPLPTVAEKISQWRREISNGRGFKVIRGFPVDSWGEDTSSLFFWCLGLHLGVPGAQNRKGTLLGHVRDTGADKTDPFVRQYMTTQNIPFHCDAADIVGLLCLKKAKLGGKSRIASSVSIYNELADLRPDLTPLLFEPLMLDTRDESAASGAHFIPVPICCFSDGELRTFYHAEYFRTSERHEGVRLTDEQRQLLDLYDKIAASPTFHIDMDLEPGDIQLLSNHSIIHARTDYEDFLEPERKRHLLRLWLSIEKAS